MHAADIKIKKYIVNITMAVFTGAVLLLGGCGSKAEPASSDKVESTDTTDKETATPKSIEEIYQDITQAVSLASPVLMDDDFIMNYYGIDASILEEYVFSMSEDATQAETVIVMKAKTTSDLDDLAACLQVVVDEKKNEMENYLPEQFTIVEKSEVKTKGSYVYLVISEQSDAILDIIEKDLAG